MILRLLVGIAAAVAIVALGLVSWVHFASNAHFESFARPAPFEHPVLTDAQAMARGEHLVRTRGCGGCHGEDLGGEVMWGYAVAPGLAAYARAESAATFEAAVRHAIGRDGRALYSMPAYNFAHLRDADIADILAYLRSVPAPAKALPRPSLPWRIRLEVALGRDAAIPAFLHLVPPLRHAADPQTPLARGEYLAMTTCNECHGFSLRGDSPWGDSAPDLAIVAAYDETAFRRLMQTGLAIGERELPMMSPVARSRFAHLTQAEVTDLYAFLRDLAARAGADPGRAR